ncbi:MAG: L-seryl-tRNA(Sec) selenium transferase [Deltaproteobacteria bacterium SG8_13]|nr:MAG: L-seryl-tRNA(Sec) selenium transferase [Deltaproteobacteria bacterium SG8_13]
MLRQLPGVDHLLELADRDVLLNTVPRSVLTRSIRTVLENLRKAIVDTGAEIDATLLTDTAVLEKVQEAAGRAMAPNLQPLVNATGIVIHTNLGRSLLAAEAVENLVRIAGRYSNLEFDLDKGKRGSRYSIVEELICEITGAEAAIAVNNNAGAVLLALNTLARGKKVIVSRGELVEIGGSFRIPDVMAQSGGIMVEVGTTNRTHLKDYENAVDEQTALLLKVHKSNYSIVGFTREVTLQELVALGAIRGIPVMEDLGSGTFIDFSRYGLAKEPTVQDSLASGLDVVTFSGDKLLGGTQAGFILGKPEIMDRIKQNPITRALRIDKLTLAALETTLRLYRDEKRAVAAIPTLRMITEPVQAIEKKALRLKAMLEKIDTDRMQIDLVRQTSKAGGGSLPLLELPSRGLAITITGMSANRIESFLRRYTPPIIARIKEDRIIVDPRTIQEDELAIIEEAFRHLLSKDKP